MSKPIIGVLLLVAAVGGTIYWLETRPAVYSEEQGYSVDLPHGWEWVKEGDSVIAHGPLKDTRDGQATGRLAPYREGRAEQWPQDGKLSFSFQPDWSEETQIAGSRAVLVTFTENGYRYLGAAIDRGARILVFRIGCLENVFDQLRPLLEKSARSIRFDN